MITVKHSALDLNVGGASTRNGADIIQWKSPGAMLVVQRPCDSSVNQRWRLRTSDAPQGWSYIVSAANSLDLNIAGGSGEYGAQLIQYRHVNAAPSALFKMTNHFVQQ